MSPHAHATSSGQHNFHVARQVDCLGMTHHLLHVRTINRTWKVKTHMPQPPCPQAVVGTDNACPPAEPDHALTVGAFDEFIVNQANPLVHDGAEELGVVGLKLVRVAEEQIRGVRNQHVQRDFLHAEQNVTAAQVLHHVNALRTVLVVPDATHFTGFHNQFHFGVGPLQFCALRRGEGHPLVRWRFAFSNNTNLHNSNVATGPPV